MQKESFISTTIAPWLTVSDGAKAVHFYKAAFDAVEKYRMEAPDGSLVVQHSIGDATFC